MFRGVLVCLVLACFSSAGTLDQAVHALARRVAPHLEANDRAHVVLHNISTLSSSDAEAARASLERALDSGQRGPAAEIEVTLTVSENTRGYLLVAETVRNGERIVQMEAWQPEAVPQQLPRDAVSTRLIWEQDSPMLDLAVIGNRMLILEPAAMVIYTSGAAGWERPDSHALDPVPVVRDPRGRLQVSGDSFTAFFPGSTCTGTWSTAFDAHCDRGSEPFPLAGKHVRFTPGRNTLELEHGPTVFSVAPRGIAPAQMEAWGDDFVTLESGCASGGILATAPRDRTSPDALTLFELTGSETAAASEPATVPGPVLALWPAENGALAIVRNAASGRYAAYGIGIDCGH